MVQVRPGSLLDINGDRIAAAHFLLGAHRLPARPARRLLQAVLHKNLDRRTHLVADHQQALLAGPGAKARIDVENKSHQRIGISQALALHPSPHHL